MHNYLVIYDIFNTKRLRKTQKMVYSYALNGQKSSRETPLNKSLMKELVRGLEEVIAQEDKVNIIKVVGKPLVFGKAISLTLENNGIVIL